MPSASGHADPARAAARTKMHHPRSSRWPDVARIGAVGGALRIHGNPAAIATNGTMHSPSTQGVTLLFAIAETNGSLEALAARAAHCVAHREFGTSDHAPVVATFDTGPVTVSI